MNKRILRPAFVISRAIITAVASLLTVAVAAAAEMEVDSQGVITEYQDGKNVGTIQESAVTFFNTQSPPGGLLDEKVLTFGAGGDIVDYRFSVPGFAAFASLPINRPGLNSPSFSIGEDAGISGLLFNPISQSTYLSSSDPWALFFNDASFFGEQTSFPVCYGGLCSSGNDPGLSPGTDYMISFSGTVHEVPEPGTLGLMSLAFAGMLVALQLRKAHPLRVRHVTRPRH